MNKRKKYTGEFKANVVKKYVKVDSKSGLEALAEQYQVHPNQIKNWKSTLFKRAHLVLDDKRKFKKIE